MYFWNFNAGSSGAFINEAGEIVAADIDELIACEYPEYRITETLMSGDYGMDVCDCCGIYKYIFKLFHPEKLHTIVVELDIDEEGGAVKIGVCDLSDFRMPPDRLK